jgi:AbrB family looped-hinge helix DNA binding protein
MIALRAKVIDGGKIVIPAKMRRALGVEAGDTVLVGLDHGEVRIRSLKKAVEHAQAVVRRRIGSGHSLADELIAERRVEAGRE